MGIRRIEWRVFISDGTVINDICEQILSETEMTVDKEDNR